MMKDRIAAIDLDVKNLGEPVLSSPDSTEACNDLCGALCWEISQVTESALNDIMRGEATRRAITETYKKDQKDKPWLPSTSMPCYTFPSRVKDLQNATVRENAHAKAVPVVGEAITQALLTAVQPLGAYTSPESRLVAQTESLLSRYPKMYEWVVDSITAKSDKARQGAEHATTGTISQAYKTFLYLGQGRPRAAGGDKHAGREAGGEDPRWRLERPVQHEDRPLQAFGGRQQAQAAARGAP